MKKEEYVFERIGGKSEKEIAKEFLRRELERRKKRARRWEKVLLRFLHLLRIHSLKSVYTDWEADHEVTKCLICKRLIIKRIMPSMFSIAVGMLLFTLPLGVAVVTFHFMPPIIKFVYCLYFLALAYLVLKFGYEFLVRWEEND